MRLRAVHHNRSHTWTRLILFIVFVLDSEGHVVKSFSFMQFSKFLAEMSFLKDKSAEKLSYMGFLFRVTTTIGASQFADSIPISRKAGASFIPSFFNHKTITGKRDFFPPAPSTQVAQKITLYFPNRGFELFIFVFHFCYFIPPLTYLRPLMPQ